eukprot:XP_011683254.1 PREDICTED: serine/threonine-protein phosphatase 6 regulatory ankyrin repeat subunit B-like [Strongylocentrotus purpuratus]
MVILMSSNTSSVEELSQGAEVNGGDNGGRTALNRAVQEGHLQVIKYLISQGAELNESDNKDGTALHVAAGKGHLDVTKYLISQGAEVNTGENKAEVNKSDSKGGTALHAAAGKGNLDVTKYLISQGADVKSGDNKGRTALCDAAVEGHLDVTKYLISQGVLGYQSIADLFMDHSNAKLDQNTDIHLAIQHGHISTIEKLVSEGADLNIQSPDGQTCLHKAIKLCNSSEKIVQDSETLRKISEEHYGGELSPEKALVFYLLENGAKLDVKDERGNLPIQYAEDEVVKQMILSR